MFHSLRHELQFREVMKLRHGSIQNLFGWFGHVSTNSPRDSQFRLENQKVKPRIDQVCRIVLAYRHEDGQAHAHYELLVPFRELLAINGGTAADLSRLEQCHRRGWIDLRTSQRRKRCPGSCQQHRRPMRRHLPNARKMERTGIAQAHNAKTIFGVSYWNGRVRENGAIEMEEDIV